MTQGHSPNILEIGTGFLFCGLALSAVRGAATWSVIGVTLVGAVTFTDWYPDRVRGRTTTG